MSPPAYPFASDLARILNAGQSRSVVLAGAVDDLFYSSQADDGGEYVPLVSFLLRRFDVAGVVRVVYELNGPIRFVTEADRARVREAYALWRTGLTLDELTLRGLTDRAASRRQEELERDFERNCLDAIGRPTAALEFLRQLTLASRSTAWGREPLRLLIFIEAADLLLPGGGGGREDVSAMSPGDRQRLAIVQDWLADPAFADGPDALVLLASSRASLHPRLARLPQLLSVEVPSPDEATRRHYITQFRTQDAATTGTDAPDLAAATAGLSIHALRQLLLAARHAGSPVTMRDVTARVEDHIVAQLGEGVVGFARPEHTLDDVVGFTRLKAFLRDDLIPRLRTTGEAALPGAAVAGPIGAGKTFLFEAVAGELGLPVLTLKNLRSQYFGQTDVLFERLRRTLESLSKAIVFIDEADTQLGSLGPDTHDTERRLVGKLQAMMSDPRLRGRVAWLLMTARIHRLSADLRRPGRMGDLIIPVLDPEAGSDDRAAFVRWVLAAAIKDPSEEQVAEINAATRGYSPAAFAALRSRLKAEAVLSRERLEFEEVRRIANDQLPADIGPTRRYQELQALLNTTRRSLLPHPPATLDEYQAMRTAWQHELQTLEATGIA